MVGFEEALHIAATNPLAPVEPEKRKAAAKVADATPVPLVAAREKKAGRGTAGEKQPAGATEVPATGGETSAKIRTLFRKEPDYSGLSSR